MHAKCSSVLGAFAKTAPLGLGVHFQYSMSACTSSSIGYLQCTVMGTCTFAFTPAAVWPCWRRSSLGASLIMLRRRRLPPPHIVQSNSSHSPTYCPHGHAAPLPCTRRAEPPAREGRQPPCPLCCRAQARQALWAPQHRPGRYRGSGWSHPRSARDLGGPQAAEPTECIRIGAWGLKACSTGLKVQSFSLAGRALVTSSWPQPPRAAARSPCAAHRC